MVDVNILVLFDGAPHSSRRLAMWLRTEGEYIRAERLLTRVVFCVVAKWRYWVSDRGGVGL